MIRILEQNEAGTLATRKTQRFEEAERVVAPILEDVRKRGDAAVLEYARKFDRFEARAYAFNPRAVWPPSSSARCPSPL